MKLTVSKLLCSLLLCLLMPLSGMACLNEYEFHGIKGNGYYGLNGFEELPDRHFGELRVLNPACATYKDSSDFAVNQLKRGYVGQGLQILLLLSAAHPHEYVIAANLGTAYELAGQNDSALKWIEYSLVLNPNAHEGTEWVHTDILKAKINLAKDSQWLSKNHVLNINRKDFGLSIFGNDPAKVQLYNTLKAIYIQLNERLPFTWPGDKIMGDICADAAQIIENTSIEVGMAWWELALEFGVPSSCPDPVIRMQRLEEAGKKIQDEPLVENSDSDTAKSRHYRNKQVNYLSFYTFSKQHAWQLRDEPVLKATISALKEGIPLQEVSTQVLLEQSYRARMWNRVFLVSGVLLLGVIVWIWRKTGT
ncbi:MAG: hypothetical protein MUC87_14145 [Bacteroidia bacterium]|jgi:tetratricopeptide (TPR) repeat protein|nr:hypothetical protein [Bacteroidia bacterium]